MYDHRRTRSLRTWTHTSPPELRPAYSVGRYPQHASAVRDFPLRREGAIAQSSHFSIGDSPHRQKAPLFSKGSDPFEKAIDRGGEWGRKEEGSATGEPSDLLQPRRACAAPHPRYAPGGASKPR